MKHLTITGTVLLFLFFQFGCNRTSKEVTKTEPQIAKPEVTKPKPIKKAATYESFNTFYKHFHNDSIFQISRIKFPLDGYAIDTSETAVKWNKKNWIMHRYNINDIDTSQFKVETTHDKNNYTEKIYIEGGGFKNERKFKRINGKWYLISYIDENL